MYNKTIPLLIVIFLFASSANAARDNTADYQKLIQKNLDLRKHLQALEVKYHDLENERGVLILHIKKLQESRDETNRRIQSLKGRVSALKIEVFKDPKMVKTIDMLNQRVREVVEKNVDLGKKLEGVEAQKEKLIADFDELGSRRDEQQSAYEREKKISDNQRKQLEDAFRESKKSADKLKASLEEVKALKGKIIECGEDVARLNKEGESVNEKVVALQRAAKGREENIRKLDSARSELKKEVISLRLAVEQGEKNAKDIKKGFAAERKGLMKEMVALKGQLAEKSRQRKRLEAETVRLKKAIRGEEEKNQVLKSKLAGFKKEGRRVGEENSALRKELHGVQKALAFARKSLTAQEKKSAARQEDFERRLKAAFSDKQAFEASVKELQRRSFAAETKLVKMEKDLQGKQAKLSLRESEIAVLREEKEKLEKKLVRYIKKIIGRKDMETAGSVTAPRPIADCRIPSKVLKAQARRDMKQKELDMRYNLAVAYDRRGMYDDERKEYLRCLKINPRDANVHYNLGILYDDKLNDNKRALIHYRKFLELHPAGEDSDQVKRWMMRAEQEDRLGPEVR